MVKLLKIKDTIDKDTKTIVDEKKLNENQIKVTNILFLVDKIFTGELVWLKKMKVILKFLKKNQMNNQTIQICLI